MFDIKSVKRGVFYKIDATTTQTDTRERFHRVAWIWLDKPPDMFCYVVVGEEDSTAFPKRWQITKLDPEWCHSFEQVNALEQVWLEKRINI